MSLFHLHFWRIILLSIDFLLIVSFQHFEYIILVSLVSSISSEKLSGNCVVPLYMVSCLSCSFRYILYFCQQFVMHLGVMICFSSLEFVEHLDLRWIFFTKFGEFSAIIFSALLLSPLFETPVTPGRLAWILYLVFEAFLIVFILFSFCSLNSNSSSLILSLSFQIYCWAPIMNFFF